MEALGLVLAIAAFSSLIGLEAAPLLDWDENMQSEVAKQVMISGDVLQLQLNGQPFTEKPPLFFVEMAGFFKLFGVSEVSARMTSAVNGLLFLCALFWIASYLIDSQFATFWCLIYGSSLIPLVFSRSAIVEHTFNSLMALGAMLLVAYDEAYSRFLDGPGAAHGDWRTRRAHWMWLLAAALSLGLAVLAKGPSGGAVPLVAFAGYKIARRGTPLRLWHWAVCGGVSLAVALSWYAANFALHGGTFLQEFARFMGLLFSKPLEGHSGPFYYHWAVALVGLFPWTPLLLLYALPDIRKGIWADPFGRALVSLGVVWALFILIVFSLVQTKLPHYSSGMYVPLTLLAALALFWAMDSNAKVPWWIYGIMAAYGILAAVLFSVVPFHVAQIAAVNGAGLSNPPEVPAYAAGPGIVLGIGIAAGALLLAMRKHLLGVMAVAVTMGAFVIGVWHVHLPLIAAYNQGPVIELMEEAYDQGGQLALYKNVSYAALFYGDQQIDMLGTYKFTGDPSRLDMPGDAPLFVITAKEYEQELRHDHPRLIPVRSLGTLVMLKLPAKSERTGSG